jgi:hypothetical protein
MVDELLTVAHVWYKPRKVVVVLSVARMAFVSNR